MIRMSISIRPTERTNERTFMSTAENNSLPESGAPSAHGQIFLHRSSGIPAIFGEGARYDAVDLFDRI